MTNMKQELPITHEELRGLCEMIESMITEDDMLVAMSEQEKLDHENQFGKHSIVIGDFIISRRK